MPGVGEAFHLGHSAIDGFVAIRSGHKLWVSGKLNARCDGQGDVALGWCGINGEREFRRNRVNFYLCSSSGNIPHSVPDTGGDTGIALGGFKGNQAFENKMAALYRR